MNAMRIGLIAGGGQFPIIFSKAAKLKGFVIHAVAYNNETDPGLKEHVDTIEWIHLGQIKRIIKFFKKNAVSQAVMMGAITKTRMFSDVRLEIKPSTFLLPDLLAQKGCWTKRKPNRSENKDIELGWRVAKEIGRLDIGQCVVVGGGSVLAVEAIDGTDATILRGGRLGKGTAVVVKVCKPDQDIRFDIPAIGVRTIKTMHEAGAGVLVVEAGKAIVFDRKEMIHMADEYGIAVVAMEK
jgi:DUF1009 family protein